MDTEYVAQFEQVKSLIRKHQENKPDFFRSFVVGLQDLAEVHLVDATIITEEIAIDAATWYINSLPFFNTLFNQSNFIRTFYFQI